MMRGGREGPVANSLWRKQRGKKQETVRQDVLQAKATRLLRLIMDLIEVRRTQNWHGRRILLVA